MNNKIRNSKDMVKKITENSKIFKGEGYILFRIKKEWKEITGRTIGENTEPVYMRNGILTVNVNDSSVHYSVVTYQNKIVEKINDFFGRTVLKSIEIKKIGGNRRRNITDEIKKNEEMRSTLYEGNIQKNFERSLKREERELGKIKITPDELGEIEEHIKRIEKRYGDISEKLKKIAVNRKIKDKYLLTKGYRKCADCGSIFFPGRNEEICLECRERKENEKTGMMIKIIRENPYIGEKDAVLLTGTEKYTYYKVRDMMAQSVYYDLLYFCENTDIDMNLNSDYKEEIRNEAKTEFEILIKTYIDYRIGSDEMAIFQNERKKVIRKIKNEMIFRKNRMEKKNVSIY